MSTETTDITDTNTTESVELGADRSDLWVERTGPRTYVARNGRGAEIRIGGQEDPGVVFSPGELLKIALAACTGLTVDAPLARRLGDDFVAVVAVSGAKQLPEDWYPVLSEDLRVDLSGLSDVERERLLTITRRAAVEHCSVSRTITGSATVELSMNGQRLH